MGAILVTGGTGFLGTNFLAHQSKESNFVVLYRRTAENFQINREYITYIDIQRTSILEVFNTFQIDGIIHMATAYGRDNNIDSVLEANLNLPLRILNVARSRNVKYFLNVESYYNKSKLVPSHLANYCLSKRALQSWFPLYEKDMVVANVILEHIYGPGDSVEKFIPYLMEKIVIKPVTNIEISPGKQERDFIFVGDAVLAMSHILAKIASINPTSVEYQVGTGYTHSVEDLVWQIIKTSNSSTLPIFGALPYKNQEIMYSVADLATLNGLDWIPKTSLVDGIRYYVDYVTGKLK
jgi:nucleoside-diphosphate-sugar epimerase